MNAFTSSNTNNIVFNYFTNKGKLTCASIFFLRDLIQNLTMLRSLIAH